MISGSQTLFEYCNMQDPDVVSVWRNTYICVVLVCHTAIIVNHCVICRHQSIVIYKTAYYSFCLPVRAAMYMVRMILSMDTVLVFHRCVDNKFEMLQRCRVMSWAYNTCTLIFSHVQTEMGIVTQSIVLMYFTSTWLGLCSILKFNNATIILDTVTHFSMLWYCNKTYLFNL